MPKVSKRIKDLPASDRPLEKLLQFGAEKLSDKELLALLIGSGQKGKNAIELAASLLGKRDVSYLVLKPIIEFAQKQGIGKMKAARIVAALELGRRIYQKPSLSTSIIQTTQDILSHCREIATKQQEYCLVLYLNARNEVIEKETIAIGSLNVVSLEPREIFRRALQLPCTSIILCHNHPSGNVQPSSEDIVFTQKVQEGGDFMGIALFDHLIIARDAYFSFHDSPQKI